MKVVSPTNLAEFRDAVRNRIGAPNADGFYDDANLTDLVNEALLAFAADVDDAPWLTASTSFSTVSGTQEYTPPADWVRTRLLSIDDRPEIEWRPLSEIREWPESITDAPRYYTVYGDQLILAPVPDGSYTVRHDYFVDELTLSADTDTPLCPVAFHYAVVAFATHLAHARGGDTTRAAMALGDYQQWLQRMKDQKRRTVGPLRVRVRPGRAL